MSFIRSRPALAVALSACIAVGVLVGAWVPPLVGIKICLWVVPQINSITPPSAAVGQQITINGWGFQHTIPSYPIVKFGGVPAGPPLSWSWSQIVVTIPPTAQPGPVTVETCGGTSNEASFALNLGPVLWDFRVKFICNLPPNTPLAAETIGLVPGEYKTDINVHNPSHSKTLNVTKKFVISIPENRTVRPTLVAFNWTLLSPDGAFFIDCSEILPSLFRSSPFARPPVAKGFVILTTNSTDLDVWAEYTAESFSSNSLPINDSSNNPTGISLDVKHIRPAPCVDVCTSVWTNISSYSLYDTVTITMIHTQLPFSQYWVIVHKPAGSMLTLYFLPNSNSVTTSADQPGDWHLELWGVPNVSPQPPATLQGTCMFTVQG